MKDLLCKGCEFSSLQNGLRHTWQAANGQRAVGAYLQRRVAPSANGTYAKYIQRHNFTFLFTSFCTSERSTSTLISPHNIYHDSFISSPILHIDMAAQASAEAFEISHVHDVYEQIATHFSSTRYKVRTRGLKQGSKLTLPLGSRSYIHSHGQLLNDFSSAFQKDRSDWILAAVMEST